MGDLLNTLKGDESNGILHIQYDRYKNGRGLQ